MTLDAGVQVEVDWHGSREPLPADIDLSAFRIIQEAVTNVVRHAGTDQCLVLIDQQDGQLSIEVTDSGRGGSGARSRGRDRLRDHRHARARRAARRRLLGRPAPRRRLPRRRPAARARAGPMTIRVILADDQPLVRAGLRMLIEQTPDIDVAGEAGTGAEAVQLARDTGPDVVVMDIRMPGMDGIEATQLITAGDTPARVLVLTTFDDDDYVYGALRAGASGFLVKDMALEDILAAIRVVAAGDAMIAPGVTRRLIAEFASQPRPGRKPRETDRDHRPRARGAQAGGPGHVQRRDRRRPVHHRRHRQDARGPAAGQAGRQGPGTARHHRVRGRPGSGVALTAVSQPGARAPRPAAI